MAIGDTDKETGLKTGSKLSLEPGKGFFLYLYSKSERIATAIYLITSLIDKGEPLRDVLRKKSLSLLSGVFAINDIKRENDSMLRTISTCTELTSLIEVALASGIISEMNATLIKSELSNVAKSIDQEITKSEGSVQIPSSMFELGEGGLIETLAETKQRNTGVTLGNHKGHSGAGLSQTKKDIQTSSRASKGQNVKEKKMSDRRDRILALVQKEGSMTVSEIGKVITDCSGKTIQRTLGSLVEEGLLQRAGERRWAKYSAV